MAAQAQYAATPRIGKAPVGLADASRVQPFGPSNVFTAGANGSRIDFIDVVGQGATTNAAVRLWLFDGTEHVLWREVMATATTPSDTVSVFTSNLSSAANNNFLPLILPNGWSLRATASAVQSGALNPTVATLCATQAVSSGANALLSGSIATAANTTSVAAGATLGGAGFMTLTASPVINANPALISLTSTGNIAAVNFTITGTDADNQIISQTIAGPNNSTVFTTVPFKTVASIFANGAVGTSTSAGVATSARLTEPTNILLASTGSLTGVNFTIVGTSSAGATITETITGPAAGTVVSTTNVFSSVARITPGGAVAEVRIGTGLMPFGFMVTARGGDF